MTRHRPLSLQMFNSIGSIYEPQSWQDGNAPDASDLTAPSDWEEVATTTTWTQDGQPTTVTTSVWVPPSTTVQAEGATAEGSAATAETATAEEDEAVASTPKTSGAAATASGSASASVSGAHNASSSNGSEPDASGAASKIVAGGMGIQLAAALFAVLSASTFGAVGLLV